MTNRGITETGIDGLDGIFGGGIPRANTILVQGPAGTGKTLMGLEFIYHGVAKFNEPGIIVVFEADPAKLIRDAAVFGWNLKELQGQDQLRIIFTSPQVFEAELRSPTSLLLETAARMGVRRIFIDGIGLLYRAKVSVNRTITEHRQPTFALSAIPSNCFQISRAVLPVRAICSRPSFA
jgi:KaiC/GvpD/RAD55 family RecA-like ATPase